MINEANRIRAYFSKLDLSEEITDLYIALRVYGPQTISELSRNAGVERTRVYRLLEELKTSNLVEVETQYKRAILSAAPVENLQILIARKEQNLHDLREGLNDLQTMLQSGMLQSELTKVQAYHGPEGLKQMYWNQTRGGGENLSILHENMQTRTNITFFERWVRACNERDVQFRGIICDSFVASQQNWYKKHNNERLRNWQARFAPADLFSITHSTVIYDDVVAYFNWKNNEVFGIEIYNQQIANAQRQFFEMLWAQCGPVDDLIGPKG